ncbi:MAG: CRISPR-associated helicase Cas3' [Gemmatimonadota bacterium]|nr:CRISPR-associated helicase Cas3' [Gemmatimonadota bacterium]
MEEARLLAFWGKTLRSSDNSSETVFNDTKGQRSYKPVLHHLMDVAAVALRWQQLNPARLEREAALLKVSPECLAKTTAFLAGVHDLGKFSRSFQAKVPELWPELVLGPRREISDRGHWRNTAVLLRAEPISLEFASLFPSIPYDIAPIIAAIAGHHGRPPEGQDEVNAAPSKARRDQQLGEECVDAAHTAFCMLRNLIEPSPLSSLEKQKQAAQWSWRLSGLVTLADWVGSDPDYFSFKSVDTRLEDYWDWALNQAKKALEGKGLLAQSPESRPSYASFAPRAAARPRPMQKLAEEAPLKDGAQLFILEDTTGAGKTEAAIMLAARMMAAGKGEGLYFALPTMATANAMYGRLTGTYQKLFEPSASENLSLVLAHGRSNLSETFRAIVNSTDMANGSEDETASAFCAQWIADNRKKAFYADVGAGTIDQAFLSILPKKHLTLRQYGLAGRILIVDEAHCFDAYMGEELSALLELHSQNGGSAIVLSATLSLEQRRNMTEAFAKGLGLRYPEDLSDQLCSEAYPLLTSATIGGVQECESKFDSALRRSVTVERLPDRITAETRALSAAKKEAAVLVICNAVDEAIAVYESLAHQMDHPDHIHLFHARFAQGDRQDIEEDVLHRFGHDAKATDRAGHILVATQVVEQSLDLDFDLVISDLAPVDLIIQRAGRMWRHLDKRPPESRPVERPHILVVSPDPDQVEDQNWLEPVLGKAAFVYQHAGVMWRSAKALFDAGRIDTPESFRSLIAHVYANEDVPPALEEKQIEDEGKEMGNRSLGRFNVVGLEGGYGSLPTALSGTEDIGTRLGEQTVTLRLARLEEGRLVAWCSTDSDFNRAWPLSEIRVREKFLAGALPPPEDQALQDRAKSDWPEWEREILIAVVETDGRVRLEGTKDGSYFTYCPRIGFRRVVPQTRE